MINVMFLTVLGGLTGLLEKYLMWSNDYLKEENQALREFIRDKCGVKRIILTNRQRKRLAVKAKRLGRNRLGETTDLFSPNTLLGWYRDLVAKKYDGIANRQCGRPKISQEKIDLALRMAKDNPSWGAGRISNWMKHLGFKISKSSVWRIMEDNGFNPDPTIRKKGNWQRFIKSHFDVLAATDFFSVELLTSRGLVRCMVLFVIDIKNPKSRDFRYSSMSQWPMGETDCSQLDRL